MGWKPDAVAALVWHWVQLVVEMRVWARSKHSTMSQHVCCVAPLSTCLAVHNCTCTYTPMHPSLHTHTHPTTQRPPPCCTPVLQMVLNTSPDVGELREVMSYVYEEIYVEYVVRNPLYTPGQPFK